MEALLLKIASLILSLLMFFNNAFSFIVPQEPVENTAEIYSSDLIDAEEKDGSSLLITDYISWYQAVDKESGLLEKYDWKFFFNRNLALLTVELPHPEYSIEIDSVSENGETLELSYTATEKETAVVQIVDYKIIVVETSKNITDISYTKNIVNIEIPEEIPEDKPRETQEVMGYKYFICEEINLASVSTSAIFHDEKAFKKALSDSASGFSKYDAKYFEEMSLAVFKIKFPEDGYRFRPVEIKQNDVKTLNSEGEILKTEQKLQINGWLENVNAEYNAGNHYVVVECSKEIDLVSYTKLGLGSESVVYDSELFNAPKLKDGESIIINDYETWLTVRHPDYYYEYKNITEKYFEEKSLVLTAVLVPGERSKVKVNSVNQNNSLLEIDCTMTADYDPDSYTLTFCKIIATEASKNTADVSLTINNDEIVFDRYYLGSFNLSADDSPILVSDYETWSGIVEKQASKLEKFDENYFKNKSLVIIPETFNNGAIEPELIKYFIENKNLEIIYGMNEFHDAGFSVIIDEAIIFEVNGKIQNISVERKDLKYSYRTYSNYNLLFTNPRIISDYDEWAELVDVTNEKYSMYDQKYFETRSLVLFSAMLPDTGASANMKYAYKDGNTLEVGYTTYSLGGFTAVGYQAVVVETDKTVTDVNVVKLK